MRLSFRQGIVSHDITGNVQAFLNQAVAGGDVKLLASNKPILVTFAHKSTNYLISENNDVVAWPGPFSVGTDYYLYWDLDTLTAQRTFGYTTLPPVAQSSPPGNPLNGQHWFDTSTNQMFVRNGNTWSEVIRVFACLLKDGNTFISLGPNSSPDFTGTQIGNNTSNLSGRILFDQTNKPIARRDIPGTFFTTEDPFFVNAALVNNIRLESNVNYAKSSESTAMAAFSIVAYQSDGTIKTAKYEDTGSTVLGIVTEDLLLNDVGAVTLQGVVTNPNWNWVNIGAPLWVDNGLLTETDPKLNTALHPVSQVPVARILSNDTVIFEQGLGGKGDQGPPGSIENIIPATQSELGGVALSTAPSISSFPVVVTDTDPRLTDARTPLPHTHTGSDITYTPGGGLTSNNVQDTLTELGNKKVDRAGDTMTGLLTLSANPTNALHAATKSYVDSFVSGLSWLEPISGFVNLIDDSLNTPPSSPKESDVYIVGPSPTGAWTGLANSVVLWDGSSWQNQGLLSSFPVGVRFGIAMESVASPGGTFAGKKNNIFTLINPSTATWDSGYVPAGGDATYVSNSSSLHAFHQFVFSGTEWVHFGGASAIIAGNNITVTGNVWNVQDWNAGGTIDAATLQGLTPSQLQGNNWLTANANNDFATAPSAFGTNSIALGNQAQSFGTNTISLGNQTSTSFTGSNAIAIGTQAQSGNTNGIAIGNASNLGTGFEGTQNSIAIGTSAQAISTNSIAIGNGASANGENGTAIGLQAAANGGFSLALGDYATAPASGIQLSCNEGTTTVDISAVGRLSLTGTERQFIIPNYPTASLPLSELGGLIYDSTTNEVKVNNGTSWISLTPPPPPISFIFLNYTGISFIVNPPVVNPIGLVFSSDGLKAYTIDTFTIYQYNIMTPWDLTTASYSGTSFSTISEGNNPVGLDFSPDGTKMFVIINNTETIFRYNLSIAFDISTAVYSGQSLTVITQATDPTDVQVSNDGTKIYVSDRSSNSIIQYDMTTAWDLSTAIYSGNLYNSSLAGIVSFHIIPDGTKMYLLDSNTRDIQWITITSPWNMSTAFYTGKSFDTQFIATLVKGISFSTDNEKMFMLEGNNDKIHEFSLKLEF